MHYKYFFIKGTENISFLLAAALKHVHSRLDIPLSKKNSANLIAKSFFKNFWKILEKFIQ